MGSSSPTDTEHSTRVRRHEAVADLSQQALETDDLDQLFRDAASTVAEVVIAEYCAVVERLPERDEGLLRGGIGWRGDLETTTVSTARNSMAGQTLRTEEPVVVDDLRSDEQFSDSELLTDHDVVSAICVTIDSIEEPWGVLGAYTTDQRTFAESDVEFVLRVAAILASAIETERERRELECERTRQERRFEAIFEDPNILVGLLEPDGTVLDINGTAMEYIDADLENVTGEPFWETPWWGDGDGIRADVERWTERAAAGEYVDFEADLTRPDGEQYTLKGVFRPVTNDDGDVVSVLVSDRDITERKARERQLEESEQRYRTLVEHFPNGAVALVDENLRYRTVGGSPMDVADVTIAEVEGARVEDAVPSALADELVPRYEAALEGHSSAFEATSNGRVFDFRIVPVRDDEGEVFAALGMSQDITERSESERRYRTLIEHFPNGGVGLFDENLRYQVAGGSAFDELGDDAETVVGTTLWERYPADLADRLEPRFRAALEGETDAFEMRFHDRDWIAHTVPVTDDEGEISAGMIMVQEITEQKERERELREQKKRLERYETIVGVVNDGVYVVDENGSFTMVNETYAEMLGYDPEELVGTDASKIVDDAVIEQVRELEATTEAGIADWPTIEADARTARGDHVPLEANFATFPDDDSAWQRVAVVRDISERKARERQLKQSNERLEQFAYAASHDLQEPLRMVTSYLQLLENRYSDAFDEDGEEFLAYAIDGADRMRAMINGLLEYSRVETRGDPLAPTDLNAVLEDVLKDLQFRIDETAAEITAEELPCVNGDASQLRQVFQNLLSNAITYSGEEPPRVHVGAERRDDAWTISVRDEGIGIEAADQDRVFTIFDRLHSREQYEGTGIGLALCERIVERHGGDIWVDSEPGEGSTFSVTLPAVRDSDSDGC